MRFTNILILVVILLTTVCLDSITDADESSTEFSDKKKDNDDQKLSSAVIKTFPTDGTSKSATDTDDTSDQQTEDKKASIFYETAMNILSSSKPDKSRAHFLLQESARLNYSKAQEYVARAMLFGNDMPVNLKQAYYYLDRLANEGNAMAQMYLGFMYATGLGVEASQPKALIYYTFAAIGGSIFAQMALGYRYYAGILVISSCDSSLSYYRRVAKKVGDQVGFGGGTAINKVRLLDELENPGAFTGVLDEDLIQYYQFLADKGDVQAQVTLGQLYYQGGRGVEQDHLKALQYFMQAVDAENALAMAFLGKMYLVGSPWIKQNNETAFKYLKMAADKGNSLGQSGLGLMYLYGIGVDKDYTKAFFYFMKASKQGWVDGQLQLGIMHLKGLGVAKNYKEAIKYFQLASKSNNVLGFYHLAEMHASGLGTLRSCSPAVELFKTVAERGHWGVLFMEAHNDYKEGRIFEAFIKYSFLAELGYEIAQSNAAFLLDREEVDFFNRNDSQVRALMHWRRSAWQGSSNSRVKLGDYYYYGYGTEVDYERAATQYAVAAQQQNAQAYFNLGFMHEQGLGLKRDFNLAKRYYDQAAVSSNDAQVPVALARIKLSVLLTIEMFKDYSFDNLFTLLSDRVGPDWDLYLCTALGGLLGIVLYLRRMPWM